MGKLLITVIALAIPAYFYTWLIRRIDRYEAEPGRYLWAAFAWGALPAIIGAVILQVIFSIPVEAVLGEESLSAELVNTAIGAPVTEEILKGMAVALIYLTLRREFDGWIDGLIYGAMAGFGFAYVENIFYLLGTESWGEWLMLFFLRTVVFGGLHGFWTGLVGIGFGLARYWHNGFLRLLVMTTGLVAAIFSHLVHNAAVTLVEKTDGATLLVALLNYGLLILFIGFLWGLASYNNRRLLRTYLEDEVPDLLSADAYAALWQVKTAALATLGYSGKRKQKLLQLATELAQKKLQLQKMGEERGNSLEISKLRQDLKLFQIDQG